MWGSSSFSPHPGYAYGRHLADMEPALKVIREHKAAAAAEVERLQNEIDARREELKKLEAAQTQAVADLKSARVELIAHDKVLQQITGTVL